MGFRPILFWFIKEAIKKKMNKKTTKHKQINSLLPRIDIEIDKYLAQNFIVINF